MNNTRKHCRRAYTIKELAVGLSCLLVAGGLLVSLTGATRDLSQTQTCMGNLRQLFVGLTAYVNQYNSYPPNGPYPTYMASETVNGLSTGGWDPSIGFIMTHGLGIEPPARFADGHFKWYGTIYEDLPEVCKCPSMSPTLLDPTNPELDLANPLESVVYNYALAYQTSGTCRAATPIRTLGTAFSPGIGGRNPAVPDPTSNLTAKPCDNAQRGNPNIWVFPHRRGAAPDDPANDSYEMSCYIQAIHPGEVQSPGRTYYFADSREYRPLPGGGYPPAGTHNGWLAGGGNRLFVGSRHFGYGNVLYLDGRVTRDNQIHLVSSALDSQNTLWRAAQFATDIRLANLRWQSAIMPVLRVKGWEYFFDANGLKPR